MEETATKRPVGRPRTKNIELETEPKIPEQVELPDQVEVPEPARVIARQVESKPEPVRIPTFDHAKNTMVARHRGVRYLVQGEYRYTFAEFNQFSKRWVPEPKPLDASQDIPSEEKRIENSIEKAMKCIEDVSKELQEIKAGMDRIIIAQSQK